MVACFEIVRCSSSSFGFGVWVLVVFLCFPWCVCSCCWIVGKFGLMCACLFVILVGRLVVFSSPN